MNLSWNPPEVPDKILADFEWGNAVVDYAADVYFGVTTLGGVRGIDRPWADVAIVNTDCPAVFADNYKGNVRSAFNGFVDRMATEFSETIDTHDFGSGGKNQKQYRPGVPTWGQVTDSGALRDSLQVEVREP